jgi:DNA-binding SARP family transcriptional activator
MPGEGLRLEVLGGFRVNSGGEPARAVLSSRAQSLVAYLVLHAGDFVPRQRLAFSFWPDSTEAQARTNLRQLLHHLRLAWPESERQLENAGQNIRWRPDAIFSLDAAELELAVAEGTTAKARGDTEAAIRAFERAASLYKGELLAGLDDEWIEQERPRFRQAHERAVEALAALYEQAGDYSAAIRQAEALKTADPLSEAAWQKLIRLHAANGDRASALRAYEECAATLRRELNAAPGPATRQAREEALGRHAEPVRAAGSCLVGRGREWQALLDAWRKAAVGRASFVLITGEAGIGKTALARELITATADQGVAAECACYAFERPLAYAAIAEWLRSKALRPALAALPAAQRAPLSRIMPELFGEAPGLVTAQPFTETWERRRLFEALARVVWSAPQPLLLFLDDLQWCDSETLDWLLYLVRTRPDARLLIAATARLDEADREGPIARAAARLLETGGAREIPLSPLSAGETAELAARISPTPVDAAPLFSQTGGNPLFIVETVRAGMAASPKVQSVITTRLAQLSAAARDVAGDASAVGRPFTVELLHTAGSGDEATLAAAVDELFARRIVQTRDGHAYDFSHGQLREVTYAQLGPARRRLIHRRLAQALERLGGATAESAEIASHYERAGDAAESIRHWERAAWVARMRYADDQAIACLTRALQLIDSLPPGRDRDRSEVKLLVALGPPLMATQGYASAEAGRVNARARMLCELVGDAESSLAVFCGSWAFHIVKGQLAAAQEIASRFVRVAAEARAGPALEAAARFTLGGTLFYRGRVREAWETCRSAMEMYAARPDAHLFFDLGPELTVFGRTHMAHALWFLGRPDAALAEIHATLAYAREISHPFSLALATAYAAMLHQFRGEPETAATLAAETAELCEKHDFRYYLSWTPMIGGWARVLRGDPRGFDQMREGVQALQATGAGLRLPYYLAMLAHACRERGLAAEGLAYVAQAVALAQSGGEFWAKSELERLKGDLLLDQGKTGEALACYHAALRTAREQEALVFELRAAAALTRLKGSDRELRRAYARFDEGFETPDLAQARVLTAATGGAGG